MKNLFLLSFLICLAFQCDAQQKYILKTGGTNYVTIIYPKPAGDSMPQDYTKGLIQTAFYRTSSGDTLMKIFSTNGVSTSNLVPFTIDTNYLNGDASNGKFPTCDSLYRWTRRNLQK